MKKTLIVLLVLVTLIISACEGGTSGSVSGSSQSCSTDNNGGICQGHFKKLSGTFSEDIPITRSVDEIHVAVDTSVDSGTVRVYLVAPDGTKTEAIVKPNEPASVSGIAEESFDTFRVYFEAMDGQAEGVTYKLSFTY